MRISIKIISQRQPKEIGDNHTLRYTPLQSLTDLTATKGEVLGIQIIFQKDLIYKNRIREIAF